MVTLLLFSSCASILSKSSYPLSIDTQPIGAKFVITDKKGIEVYTGTTPAVVTLKSGNGYFSNAKYNLNLSLPGYVEKNVTISSSINGWYFGNILLGGLIGMLIVDPITGAMWKLDTEYVNETLIPSSNSSINNPELRILDINNIPADWKGHLVKIN